MAKMNWYKKAFDIKNFQDRNVINERIRVLSQIAENLYAVKENALQNPAAAKQYLDQLSEDKIFSSFPTIEQHFTTASGKMLDNPQKSTDIIEEIVMLIVAKVDNLKAERSQFTQEELPKKLSF